MKPYLNSLTYILATLSLASLISNLAEIGLTGIMADIVKYYRVVSYDIFTLNGLIEVNRTIVDLWTISFIGAAAYAKSPNIRNSRLISSLKLNSFGNVHRIVVFVTFGLTMLGIAVVYYALNPFTYVDDMHERPLDLFKDSSNNLVIIGSALAVVFAYNAYAPSL